MAVVLENFQRTPFVERFSEDEREEMRMENQAILARWLKKEDERRLLSVTTQCSETEADNSEITYRPGYIKKPWFENVPWVEIGKRQPGSITGSFVHEKKDRVIRLTGVAILPKVGGQGEKRGTIIGTLEAHVNGYIYTSSSFRKHFYFDDIQYSFFRLGDSTLPPLLHFHMHPPLKKKKKKEDTKEFEFHLVKCPPGQNRQRRSHHDSDKIEKQNISDNERLKNFVDEVHARWDTLPISPRLFVKLAKEYEFDGNIHWKGSSVYSHPTFVLTPYDLIVLVETPFTVFPMEEIEIVNLSVLGSEKINMAVIFKDFKEESVLLINAIPLKAFAAIKDRLNSGFVKYYVNTKEIDWKATVRDIAAFPERFISMGGWDQFELEDGHTLAYNCRPPKRNLVVMKERKNGSEA